MSGGAGRDLDPGPPQIRDHEEFGLRLAALIS